MTHILDLPSELLLRLFTFLDLRSLTAVSHSCYAFYHIVNEDFLKYKTSQLLCTNQLSPQCRNRSVIILSPLQRLQINRRWRRKSYKEKVLLKSREKFRPCLWMEGSELFVAQGQNIYAYRRTEAGVHPNGPRVFSAHSDDVTRLKTADLNTLLSCSNDGKLICWSRETGRPQFSFSQDVQWNESLSMDCSQPIAAVGHYRAATVQFFSKDAGKFSLQTETSAPERIWAVALSDDSASCVIATAGYLTSPLALFDIQRKCYKLRFQEQSKVGAGVFAAQWESPHLILTGSFDTFVRLWDTRNAQAVRQWADPYDSAIYSICSDRAYTIMAGCDLSPPGIEPMTFAVRGRHFTPAPERPADAISYALGTARHGRITLYDTRHSNCIQMYDISSRDGGPVYNLQFDATHMVAALQSSVHVLNFAHRKN